MLPIKDVLVISSQNSTTPAPREKFSSRLGFILISAGCAIGLGNVWRFPYITGQYGGAAFVLIYLVFLIILGVPVMVMEFSVGRASKASSALAFDRLQPSGRWHWLSWLCIIGNYTLMMFYTTVGGWMLSYIVRMGTGEFVGMSVEQVGGAFSASLASPTQQVAWMLVALVIGFFVCSLGLQKGVERVTKVMMVCLLAILVVLVFRSVTLPGASEGLAFYLVPDFSKLFAGATAGEKLASFGAAAYAAMGQSFFTLSIGIGAMEIFGSYIGKDRSLTGEAMRICGLDTFVAIMAGLIIFPACFAFGINPGEGPSLVFVTLPAIFDQMPLGQLWGALFFVFMSFAALSTIIAVFENIISFSMDKWGLSRQRAVAYNAVLLIILSLPCALGFNVWSGVTIPGIGDIQSIEDFVISNNILPLGSLFFLIFCLSKKGWGWENFLAEADAGKGMKFPAKIKGWLAVGVPVLIAIIFVMGYVPKFAIWMGLGS